MYNNLAKPFFIGKRVVYMPTCHSTNEVASEMVKNGQYIEGTIVITDHQFAGRGQHGNSWEAEPHKNLTFSMILKPVSLSINEHFMLNIIISLGISDYLIQLGLIDIAIKWPNDIYVKSKKIAGILIQNTVKRSSIENSIIGIGLNVNQVNFENKNATSVSLHTNQDYSLHELLEGIVLSIEARYLQFKSGKSGQLREEYTKAIYWLDKVHTFEDNSGFFSGIIRGINWQGQLEIECEESTKYFNFKEVKFIK